MMNKKLYTAEEAVKCVEDGSVIVASGFIVAMSAEELFTALSERFQQTGSPKDITVIHGSGVSEFADGLDCGINNFGIDGMLKRTISGYYGNADRIIRLIRENKIESYNFPIGVVAHLLREFSRGQDGLFTKVGLKTFVDPRLSGAGMNEVSKEEYVKLLNIEGKEYLYYTCQKPDVCFIRATTADEFGNLSFEDEAVLSLSQVAAMATHQNGGTVIVQVKNYVSAGSIDAQQVHIPGIYVDRIVVAKNPIENHRQVSGTYFDPVFAGHYRKKDLTAITLPLDERKIVGRRASMELVPGAVVNLGIGMPETVSAVAAEEGFADQIVMTVEAGGIGGIPAGGRNFGACYNNWSLVSEEKMFDFYDGGGLDVCFLGCAEISRSGDVNASKLGGSMKGCGGFINISQMSKNIVFCFTFTSGGLKTLTGDGKLQIVNEGRNKKFLNNIEQVTFSSEYAVDSGQNVLFVTERCVFKLTKHGLELIEIAPGIDIERDILANMDYKPYISPHLKTMDERIFKHDLVGVKDIVMGREKA